MNDDDLLAMVRQSFTGLRSTTPVEKILRHGRTVKARRRLPVLTGALAGVAGAALAITIVLPGGRPPGPQPATSPTAELAAWTVTRQPDGTIKVTVRELRDPAGLQSLLRADGVPASVTLSGQENPSCRPYRADPGLQDKVVTPTMEFVRPPSGTPGPDPYSGLVLVLVIHPSALPRGVGLQFATGLSQSVTAGGVHNTQSTHLDLVYASPQCTGSAA